MHTVIFTVFKINDEAVTVEYLVTDTWLIEIANEVIAASEKAFIKLGKPIAVEYLYDARRAKEYLRQHCFVFKDDKHES